MQNFFYVILFKVFKYFSCLFVHFFHISVCRRRKNATVYQKSSFVIYLKHFICSPSECVRKLKIFGPLGFSVPKWKITYYWFLEMLAVVFLSCLLVTYPLCSLNLSCKDRSDCICCKRYNISYSLTCNSQKYLCLPYC